MVRVLSCQICTEERYLIPLPINKYLHKEGLIRYNAVAVGKQEKMEKDNILEKIKKLERENIPVYILFDGINPMSWIVVEVALENKDCGDEIDVILLSGGGRADEAYKMIRAFRQKYSVVNVIIPFWAKSAATLFAFGATRIVFHPLGELGPIDAQIKKDDEKSLEGETSSALVAQSSLEQIEKRSREGMYAMYTQFRSKDVSEEIIKIGRKQLAEMLLDYAAKFYAPLVAKIDPTEMGNMARTLDIGRMYARRILRSYTNTSNKNINDLLDFLVYECPDHAYVVDYDVASTFLPNVIKADQEPFSPEYCKNLGKISLHMITNNKWPDLNGFLDDLTQEQKPVNIKRRKKMNKNKKEKNEQKQK